jgi:hypothetical protein
MTLWEIMEEFRAPHFWWLSHDLLRLEAELAAPLDKGGIADLEARIKYAKEQCDSIGLGSGDAAMVPLYNIAADLSRAGLILNFQINVENIKRDLKTFRQNLEIELSKRKFVLISEHNTKYFEQDRLFGDAVYDQFEKARQDIKDAGSCLTVGLSTACIFHLMRVAEIGLRHIATKVGVKLTDKGKPQPIEYATWDKVIQGISTEITEARKLPQGPRKSRRLNYFSNAAEQCSYLKEWRNEVSHTRKRFNEPEALGVMQRVRDFMELLSGEI